MIFFMDYSMKPTVYNLIDHSKHAIMQDICHKKQSIIDELFFYPPDVYDEP